MAGVIRSRHLFTHAPIIIRGFGWRVWIKGVWKTVTFKRFTFLSLL